jgi:hypothetical protein
MTILFDKQQEITISIEEFKAELLKPGWQHKEEKEIGSHDKIYGSIESELYDSPMKILCNYQEKEGKREIEGTYVGGVEIYNKDGRMAHHNQIHSYIIKAFKDTCFP